MIRGIRRRLCLFLVNRVFAGLGCYGIKRACLNAAGHRIGPGTRIVGPVACTGRLITGSDCWIGRELTIHGNGTVTLGDRCDLAPQVCFLTGGHRVGPRTRRAGEGTTRDIVIGSGCWLGCRATVLGGVAMGPGSVLAACGCAVRDIPADTLAAGIPARPVRKLHE